MAYRTATEGGYGASASVIHTDPSHSDFISVPDAELLFKGHFGRSGPDLVLTGQDGRHHIVPGYFSSENPPALVAPNGASLSPDVVHLLAGSPTPGQYAQAQQTLPPDAIGKVEKVVGNVTVLRNGTSVTLHVGDAVHKSDVVETGANSSVGIAFPDGTALDLVANTRMALSEYSFDAAGTANSAVFSLVQGTFAFVAGQVAHTGDGMKINTPVATMGIRGTVGLFKSEPTIVNANLGHVWSIFLHEDIDGSHHLGRIAIIDPDPASPTYGQVIYVLDSSEYAAYLEPQGPGVPPVVRLEPITNSRIFDDRHFFDDLNQVLGLFNGTINPQSNPSAPGSGDNPNQLFQPPHLFDENGGQPLFIKLPSNGGDNNTGTTQIFTIPLQFGQNPNIPSPTPTTFIWPAGNQPWDTATGWNTGTVPTASSDTVEIQSGTVIYNPKDNYTVGTLIVDLGATLDMIGGSLAVLNRVNDFGLIQVGAGDPPTLTITGPVTVETTGELLATGNGATISISDGKVDNFGFIDATQGGAISIDKATLTNELAAVIEADHGGTLEIDSTPVTNTGRMLAADSGMLILNGETVTNSGGTVQADAGSTVDLESATISGGIVNVYGLLDSTGTSAIDGAAITITGTLEATSGTLTIDPSTISNSGELLATDGSTVVLDGVTVSNTGDGTVEVDATEAVVSTLDLESATISGGIVNVYGLLDSTGTSAIDGAAITITGTLEATSGTLTIDPSTISNSGELLATDGSTVVLDGVTVSNTGDGTVEVDATEAVVSTLDLESATISGGIVNVYGLLDSTGTSAIDGAAITITGTLEATSGTLTIDPSTISNSGELLATDGSTVVLDGVTVSNTGDGTVEVDATEAVVSTLDLESATISGGIVNVYGLLDSTGTSAIDGAAITITGTLEATSGTLTIDPSTISNSGELLATDGSTVVLDGVTVSNTGDGTVEVDATEAVVSTLDLESATISGGIVNVYGLLDSTGTSAIDGAAITITGTLEATSGTLTIDPSTISNSGELLATDGSTVVLDGVTVSNTGNGTVEVDATEAVVSTLDLESATISGGIVNVYGLLDSTGTSAIDGAAITITGTLEATSGTLTIDPSTISNSGELLATDGSTVVLDGVTVSNTGDGTVEVDATEAVVSTLDLESATISGGIVNVYGLLDSTGTSAIDGAAITITGTLEATSGTLTIDPSTISNSGELLATDGSTVVLDGVTVSNTGDGTVEVDATEAVVSTLDLESATISGGIVNVYGLLDSTGTSAIDGAAITITGTLEATSGTLTIDPSTISNSGLVEANGGTLEIDSTPVTNTGEMLATDDSTLILNSDPVTNSGGTIAAIGWDATVNLDQVTIIGGELETSCGGLIQTVCGNSTFKDDVTIAGGSDVLVNDGTSLTLVGQIHDLGTITVGLTETDDDPNLIIDGNVTLDGGGRVILSGPGNNIVGASGDGEGNVLTNHDDISGAGTIGNGGSNLTLINEFRRRD